MAVRVDEVELDLQGGIGYEPQQVGLGHYLEWHEVEYGYTQGAYVLT